MSAQERYDEILMEIAGQQGGIEPLLKVFFSFLHRKTDFFVVYPKGTKNARMGFAPGAANVLVKNFRAFPTKPYDQMVSALAPAPAAAGAKASAPAAGKPAAGAAKAKKAAARRPRARGRARARACARAAATGRGARRARGLREGTAEAAAQREGRADSDRERRHLRALLVDADAVRRDRVRRPAREGRLEGRGRRAHERPAQGRAAARARR